MDNNIPHIDKIIKEKFEQFAPVPPEHIWTGIENEIRIGKTKQISRNRWFIAAAVLILFALVSAILLIKPSSFEASADKSKQITDEVKVVPSTSDDINELPAGSETIVSGIEKTAEKEDLVVTDKQLSNNKTTESQIEIEPKIASIDKSQKKIELDQQVEPLNSMAIVGMRRSVLLYPGIFDFEYLPEDRNVLDPSPNPESIIEPKNELPYQRWKISYYITPELSIATYDSVEILNSYTLSVEPTYFLNENFFIRTGVGLSYVRDRGFARIKYITNEYMGSYKDVYDITFDTVLGNIMPVYHTKTVEVWDSIPHISVSGVTNKYLYLQVPALFGYQYKKPGSLISWYFMGGPAVNIKVGSWIDNPKPDEANSDIVDLKNNLPKRSDIYFQLWLGAGLEYEINKKVSIAIEPGYRYYFKSIYNNPYNHTSSSGFTLRVGLVYMMK